MAVFTESDPLPLSFYNRETVVVARELLGKALKAQTGSSPRVGRIVETEAYVGDDPANHAYRGPTEGNRSMFKAPGTLYVYPIHGVYCLNVVTERGEAVLIRALEPLQGIDGRTDGPGRLCRALEITRDQDGQQATGPDVAILQVPHPRLTVGVSRRTGVTKAEDRLLRFFVQDNPHVSRGASAERTLTRAASTEPA